MNHSARSASKVFGIRYNSAGCLCSSAFDLIDIKIENEISWYKNSRVVLKFIVKQFVVV